MKILRTYGRIWADDLDRTLPYFEEMVGRKADLHFAFKNVKSAAVGHFLIIQMPPEERSDYPGSTTVVVSDLDELKHSLAAEGGRITVPEMETATGRRLYARHSAGAEVEYVEWTSELVERIVGRL